MQSGRAIVGSMQGYLFERPAPDLRLPLHPLKGQNANLYDVDWRRTMLHNRTYLQRAVR